MRDRILFSAPMVQAIRLGRKTQTRRAVKPAGNDGGFILVQRDDGSWWPLRSDDGESSFHTVKRDGGEYHDETPHRCPYGKPGARLYVCETYFSYGRWVTRFSAQKGREEWHFIDMTEECGHAYQYAADKSDLKLAEGRGPTPGWHRRPAIFMPRKAVRIVLEVVSVRVERLQDISESDAIAEGIIQQTTTGWFSVPGINGAGTTARAAYALLWNSINGAGSWAENPWVWVYEFKEIEEQKHV